MDDEATVEVLARFFAAIEAGDFDTVAELYHPDVRVWHSVTDAEQDKAQNLRLLSWLRGAASFRYELLEQLVSGGEVARRHIAHFQVDGQDPIALHAALFITVEDGQVRRIAEYVDSAGSQQLLASIPSP